MSFLWTFFGLWMVCGMIASVKADDDAQISDTSSMIFYAIILWFIVKLCHWLKQLL